MTDEPVAEQEVNEQPAAEGDLQVEVEEAKPEKVYCRHCGQARELAAGDDPDWLCEYCDKYQDTMACPECGQPTRISLMDPAKVPAPHGPARRKKGDE